MISHGGGGWIWSYERGLWQFATKESLLLNGKEARWGTLVDSSQEERWIRPIQSATAAPRHRPEGNFYRSRDSPPPPSSFERVISSSRIPFVLPNPWTARLLPSLQPLLRHSSRSSSRSSASSLSFSPFFFAFPLSRCGAKILDKTERKMRPSISSYLYVDVDDFYVD